MKNYIKNIQLQVSDLDRSAEYYKTLGFQVDKNENDKAKLFTSSPDKYVIDLIEVKGSKAVYSRDTGLYHAAIKVPDRSELARIFLRLQKNGTKFGGFSDHIVSEAIYLNDPDDNGIEIYSDKEANGWEWVGNEINMDTLPLNLNDLVKDLKDENTDKPFHEDTVIGHLHLKVSDLLRASAFYKGILGMDITTRSYSGALFFSWDKYHHHIGANVWRSLNGKPPGENSAGLRNITISLPENFNKEEMNEKLKKNDLIIQSEPEFVLVNDFDYNKIRILYND